MAQRSGQLRIPEVLLAVIARVMGFHLTQRDYTDSGLSQCFSRVTTTFVVRLSLQVDERAPLVVARHIPTHR
jgi:hypothetical protein